MNGIALNPDSAESESGDSDEPHGTLGLLELILKNPRRLERVVRNPLLAHELVPRFLTIAVAGFTLFAVALAIVISSVGLWPHLTSARDFLTGESRGLIKYQSWTEALERANPWFDGSALQLIGAYDLGLIAAAGVCLPSLYFYGLLAGVRMSMLDVVVHTLKALAVSAVSVVGILPIYVAFAMGAAIFGLPVPLIAHVLNLGLLLPFIAGVWGVHSLYCGFVGLADTMPLERRCRRECFLRRLVFSWAACYTAVTPVMVFTLWEYLGRA